MLRPLALCLAFSVALVAAVARAQNPSTSVQEVRRQIDQLEQTLQKLESKEHKNERVTEIGSATMRTREVGIIVRLYDINDLFAVAPNYEARRLNDLTHGQDQPLFPRVAGVGSATGFGGMGGSMGGGGGMFNVPDSLPKALPDPKLTVLGQATGNVEMPSARTSIDALIEAIKATIAPTSWTDVGGEGSIARLGNSLLISAEAKTHSQIEALLGLFRQRWKTLRTVTVRLHWLWLTDEQLATLLPEKRAADAPYALVDEAAWQKRPRADERFGPGYRAVITCYNGQTVNTVAGGQNLLVTSVSAVSSKDPAPPHAEKTIYSPSIVSIQDGAGLQITPLVSASGKYVVLDVHSRVTRLSQPTKPKDSTPKADPPQEIDAAVNRTVVVTQQLATTLRVPGGKTMLVGGMTFEIEPAAGSADLYLFANATVQEFQDETPPTDADAKQPGDK